MSAMQTKFLEIRDECTRISAMAMKFPADLTEAERWLVSSGGWGRFPEDHANYIFLVNIDGDFTGHADAYDWPAGRSTMHLAHDALMGGWWDKLESGDVLDVRCTLDPCDSRYRPEPVQSDRLYDQPQL
jgi:hypothetical protein